MVCVGTSTVCSKFKDLFFVLYQILELMCFISYCYYLGFLEREKSAVNAGLGILFFVCVLEKKELKIVSKLKSFS